MDNIQSYIDFFESKLSEANEYGKKGKMGMVRSTMKDSVELLLDLVWTTERGGESKKNDFVESKSKNGYVLKFQVDRHLYDTELKGLAECKSYLDRCFMERASSDFGRIKNGIHQKPKSFILALEDAVSETAYNYYIIWMKVILIMCFIYLMVNVIQKNRFGKRNFTNQSTKLIWKNLLNL